MTRVKPESPCKKTNRSFPGSQTGIIRELSARGLAGIVALLLVMSVSHAQPVKVILDTDMESDVDDVGTLAMLHALADHGEVEILGVMLCAVNEWSTLCADRINTYFGRPNLPLGNLGKRPGVDRGSRYARQVSEEFPGPLSSADEAPDAVRLYRQLLASHPDNSVVIVSIGYLTNLRDLLQSAPDEFSRLHGRELVEQKVRLWVCMGGRFPEGLESNIRYDSLASKEALAGWPTEIVFSGWRVGNMVDTGSDIMNLPSNSPVRRAYELFGRIPHKSWDQVALLYAVRGVDKDSTSGYWDLSGPGSMCVRERDGRNWWHDDPDGDHNRRHKLVHRDALSGKFAAEIDSLMMHVPEFPEVEPAGLIAYYPLSEGEGDTAYDHSGFGEALDLILSGGVQWLDGGGVQFDGAAAKLQSTGAAAKLHSQITATGRFSVEVWGKPDQINQGGPARVVSYSADRRARNFTLAHGRWPETNNDLTLRARTSETGDNGEPPIYAPGALDTSSQHLVVSYDGEVVRFFRNGGKISSGTYGHLRNWNAVYPLVLGNETTGDRGWVGELYSVAVYDYALTAMEIQEKLSRRGKSSTNNSRH